MPVSATSVGEWRSPVARLLWEQDVAGSNPVSPTINLFRGCQDGSSRLHRSCIFGIGVPPVLRGARLAQRDHGSNHALHVANGTTEASCGLRSQGAYRLTIVMRWIIAR
jgi:hypothetical protein